MDPDLTAHSSFETVSPGTPWGMLPPSLRVLFLYEKSPAANWIVESIEHDAVCQVKVTEATNPLLGLERLREETFDAVLVAHEGPQTLDWIEALRVGSTSVQPILVLGTLADREFSAMSFESGADGYLTIDSITTRELIWHLARAAERRRLMEENERNRVAEQRRRAVERDEASRILEEQKSILNLQSDTKPPEWVTTRTRELLTTYVVMGTGQLADEMDRFFSSIQQAGIDRTSVVKAFHEAMDTMVAELGTRSAKHIINRGNVLLLEALLRVPELPMQPSLDSNL